jgi:hypothetical protein
MTDALLVAGPGAAIALVAVETLALVDTHETATAVCVGEPFALVVEPQQAPAVLLAVGDQGPAGPAGVPGPAGGSAFQRVAGETISALRVLYELGGAVFALDYRAADYIDFILGISLTAADPGQPLNVQRSGALEDSGWNWAPGRIWLGANGALTQTPPADGFDVLIGAAVSATRITLNITDPINLE